MKLGSFSLKDEPKDLPSGSLFFHKEHERASNIPEASLAAKARMATTAALKSKASESQQGAATGPTDSGTDKSSPSSSKSSKKGQDASSPSFKRTPKVGIGLTMDCMVTVSVHVYVYVHGLTVEPL